MKFYKCIFENKFSSKNPAQPISSENMYVLIKDLFAFTSLQQKCISVSDMHALEAHILSFSK